MQCLQCKYLMSDFDEKCPRCGASPAEAPQPRAREDVVRNTTFAPGRPILFHPFPAEGRAMVARNGTRYGPYSLEEINGYLKTGNLVQSDQLLTDAKEWIVLRKIEGVVTPASAPPPPFSPAQAQAPAPVYGTVEAIVPEPTFAHTPNPRDLYQPPTSMLGNSQDVRFYGAEEILTDEERRNTNALAVLGFLFPILGLIAWACVMNSKPRMASVIAQWSVIGFVVGLIIITLTRL